MSRIFEIQKSANDDINRKTSTAKSYQQVKGAVYPLHDMQTSIDIIMSNIYAKRCIDEIYKTTVGKGFEIIPEEWKSILDQDYLERIEKDYLKTSNSFTEVRTLNGKIIALYHVPVCTMVKMAEGTYTQPNAKNKIVYDSFTKWTGTETGEKSFILHIMDYEDDQNYGTPFWLAAEYKITQSTNSDLYNSNFFKNDCKPEGVILGKNLGLTDEEETSFENFLKRGFKGVGNSRKQMVLFTKAMENGGLEYVKFGESIIDMSFINLLRENKTDICAAFRVPPKLVGLETPGRLGGGNDFQQQVNVFYENEIIPRQVYYEQIFSKMAGSTIQFVRPKMMELAAATPDDQAAEVQKSAKQDAILDCLKLIADKL